MRPWIKASLLIATVVGLSWGGAIWYWRATNRMPATGDMVLYMVALPLGILISIAVGRMIITRMAAAPAPAPAPVQAAQATPPPAAVPALALLAASVNTAHGASAADLSASIADGKARAELDSDLLDGHGFPVMTMRNAAADDSEVQDQVLAWFTMHNLPEPAFNAEQWRALSMATAVAADLAGQAAALLAAPDSKPLTLYLQPLLPPEWDVNLRAAAGQWLRHVVADHGWPEKQLTLAAAVPVDARGASVGAVMARLGHQNATSGLPLAAIVLACDSHLGDGTVDRWSASAQLFAAARPQGRIPGEGAAGLLLTDQRLAQSMPGVPHTIVHYAPEARRHTSADEAKKPDGSTVSTMAKKLMEDTGTGADTIGMLVADTDHRTSRVMELMEVASGALPHLDATTEVLRAGAACGSCGGVPFVAALALSHHNATELKAPVLCISNDDPYRRSAVLIRPAAALS